jgi:hypothetical protein
MYLCGGGASLDFFFHIWTTELMPNNALTLSDFGIREFLDTCSVVFNSSAIAENN